MGFLKGPVSDGVIQVQQKVKFTKQVQSSFFEPWSDVWYVDGTNGSDDYDGTGPSTAKATIQAAVTAASGFDVIYIRPKVYTLGTGFARYTEDVTVSQDGTGSGTTEAGAGRSLIGITPRGHPSDFLGVRWKYATSTNLNIESPATHVENIGFFTEDAGGYGVYLECDGSSRTKGGTDGSSFYNCAFKGDGDVYADGGNEIQIVNCRFQAKHDGTPARINFVGSAHAIARPLIQNCEFIGGNANAMATAPIIGAAPWYDAMIRDCYFLAETGTTEYINIAGSTSTGAVLNCFFPVTYDAGQIVQGGLSAAGLFFYDGLATAV